MVAAAKPPASLAVDAAGREGNPDVYVVSVPQLPSWPELAQEALHGLPGDIVEAIDPHTEADRVAVLASLLAAFGNAIGRGAFFRVGADVHHLKLNVGLVGDTSKGRKGMSWGHVRELMRAVVEAKEPQTEANRVAVLASVGAAFGNAIGRGAFFRVGADVHHVKLNVGLVGDTSKGRKGMSWGHVRELMRAVVEAWTDERVLH